MIRKLSIALALMLFSGHIPGCGGSGAGVVFPIVAQVVVVNTQNSFTVTLVGFGYDGTVNQNWKCDGDQAKLTLGTSMFGGTMHIVIKDHAGTTVYNNIHSGSMGGLTVQTDPGGVPGTWNVFIDFNDSSWAGAITVNADFPDTKDAISIGSGIGGSDTYIFHATWDGTVGMPVHVSVATGMTSGTVRVRIWDPLTLTSGPASYDVTQIVGAAAVSDDIQTGGSGTWTVQIDFSGCTLGGAISITNN